MGDNGSSERLLIISSDGHIGPPAERYREYMDPKYLDDYDQWFREFIPLWMTKGTRAKGSAFEALDHTMWGTEYADEFERRASQIPWGIEGKWDAKKRLEALDIDGVTSDVMFPDDQSANSPPFLGLARDARWEWDKYSTDQLREGARAYNRWLVDFCSEAPERLLGVALLGSLEDVDGAIETATWAKEHGLNGGLFLPVNYYNNQEPFWNDRRYEKLWAAVVDLDMPLHTHVGPGSPYYGDDSFEAWIIWCMESTFWVHRPLWFFILGGILERHPQLKLIFTEQGVDWIPPTLMAMDGILEAKMTPFAEDEKRSMFSLKPSEYFQRQCWVGATNTDALGWVTPEQLEMLGYKKLMWGSDYPHMESFWPHTRDKLHQLVKGIPEDQVKAIICDNALEAYSLDRAQLEPTAARIGPTPDEIISE
jgi:predicted TIM-barrel fold metal-dependent hydrolase